VRTLAGIVVVAAVAVSCASAGTARTQLGLKPVASGLSSPVYVASIPGQPSKLYVVEQVGRIRVLVNGKLSAKPFLDIRSKVRVGSEQGLLSVAFHPNYKSNHKFYVNYTDTNGDTRVVEYKSNGVVALRALRQILFVKQPYANHNGGGLQFGPDGWLYVGMGDGGSGGDPQNRAQNLKSRLGKLLKINVNSKKVNVQIAGYGLRNPWRFSFDKPTGDLYIGDVGQNQWEEIDYTPKSSPGLENYGWRVYEGTHGYAPGETPNATGHLVMPVAEYSHGSGCSVTGGYVYRGTKIASLQGRYMYGDYCSGKIWTLVIQDGKAADVRTESITVKSLSSFGVDTSGELYATSLDGTVYAITG
jgi:glucose/arabinose dehydrogenase